MTLYAATLIAGKSQALPLEIVAQATRALEVQGARSITIRWLDKALAADLSFTHENPALLELTAALRHSLGDTLADVIVQAAAHRRKKLLVADMESTMIENEMLDELAEMIGQREKITRITTRAMNGELDFAAALRERAALLKGQQASLLERAAAKITEMPGATALVTGMRAAGAVCWLVTGGFTCFAEPVAQRLGFDAVHANRLMVEDGVLTGEVAEPILDKDAKRRLLEQACAGLGIGLHESLAIGDGANDIPMLQACDAGNGLGVAFHAKPKVREVVLQQVNHTDLSALLFAQGLATPAIRV